MSEIFFRLDYHSVEWLVLVTLSIDSTTSHCVGTGDSSWSIFLASSDWDPRYNVNTVVIFATLISVKCVHFG